VAIAHGWPEWPGRGIRRSLRSALTTRSDASRTPGILLTHKPWQIRWQLPGLTLRTQEIPASQG
jgi:hypothetical protein